ncbi:hypothetical protein DFA_07861 [Cavenderia fasciculata]|uniref:PNPLA domain-containing protein n=1 Tax=Cavenderia fasciculata TaxID=261658 RepID=F4Q3R5_CACFS|nr:uncharacterized protein DFA_07861 [Cavenderia fasciculata]EGG16881.1 hypothetical protein DFA_07861 [Cavenderia fasciculata]|eukprot:XP_004355355.1 hypothetical protein DFA_07861 [Cavenderia fasciculata]
MDTATIVEVGATSNDQSNVTAEELIESYNLLNDYVFVEPFDMDEYIESQSGGAESAGLGGGDDTTNTNPRFGLSIDGGGMRGLMPAIWLKELERQLHEAGETRPLSQVFSFIGGTSIGGILAMGLAKGIKIDDLINIFQEHGKEVFHKNWYSLGGIVDVKYDSKPLFDLLESKQNFGKSQMQHLDGRVMVTSCTTKGTPFEFCNTTLEQKYYSVAEVCRCTSAAPTYFSGMKIENDIVEDQVYVDGGMWMNNPSTIVARKIVLELQNGSYNKDKLLVLSLGTGLEPVDKLAKNTTVLGAGKIISTLMKSNMLGTDHTMKSFLGENYVRVQVKLKENIDLADCSPKALEQLNVAAGNKLENGKYVFDRTTGAGKFVYEKIADFVKKYISLKPKDTLQN